MPENASTQMSYDDKNLYATLSGEIDHHTAKAIRRELDEQMCRFRPMVSVLNLKQVSFMDSSGVGLVMGRYRQMKLLGGALRVKNYSDSVYRIFAMSGLEALGVLQ